MKTTQARDPDSIAAPPFDTQPWTHRPHPVPLTLPSRPFPRSASSSPCSLPMPPQIYLKWLCPHVLEWVMRKRAKKALADK